MSEFIMGGATQGVPAGAYTGHFVGYEAVPPREEMGEGIRFQWRIDSGTHQGKIVGRITGTKPTTGNACGKMLVALAGRKLNEGEAISTAEYVGKRYTLIVQQTASGGIRVETAVRQD